MENEFIFRDATALKDDEIYLEIERVAPADDEKGFVPSYIFGIHEVKSGARLGGLSLRVGDTEHTYFRGNMGYDIDLQYRGYHYAAKACRLALILAEEHGMKRVIIACHPDNVASQKTCEYLGARLLEIATVPKGSYMYERGERQEFIYLLEL